MKIKNMILLAFCAVAVLTTTVGQAQAGIIGYEYTGSWRQDFLAPFGADYSATVYLDNGGMDPANQLFTQSDFVSATLTSGSYSGTMLPGDITSWVTDFTSDSLGQLGSGWFDAVNAAGDNWHFDNVIGDENFRVATGGFGEMFAPHTSNPGVLVGNGRVPEPTSLAIFGTICLVACGRRRSS